MATCIGRVEMRCSVCNDQAGDECALEVTSPDDSTDVLTLGLCPTCRGALLAEDWITRTPSPQRSTRVADTVLEE
jgi:hypothetical protein